MSHCVEEAYDVYDETPRRAAKEKPCDACGRTVIVGEIYMRVFTLFDGTAESVNRCGACQAMHKHLRGIDSYGETWPDERLGCGLDYREEWGCDPPEKIAALAFATAHEASQQLERVYADLLLARRNARDMRKRARKVGLGSTGK